MRALGFMAIPYGICEFSDVVIRVLAHQYLYGANVVCLNTKMLHCSCSADSGVCWVSCWLFAFVVLTT